MGSSVSNVSLLQQVRQVARRARRLLWIRSLVLVAAAALLIALLAILFDYGVHVDHRGLRWLVSLGLLGGWLAFAGRVLRPLVGLQLNEVNTVRWMERAYPVLQDRLSSAIQFLRDAPRDAAAGSTDLRTALVQQATAQSAQLELDRVLDGRCIWRAAAWGAGAIAFLAGARRVESDRCAHRSGAISRSLEPAAVAHRAPPEFRFVAVSGCSGRIDPRASGRHATTAAVPSSALVLAAG